MTDKLPFHRIRSYAAQLQRVADFYKKLEQLARESETDFVGLVDFAGKTATDALKQTAALLETISPADWETDDEQTLADELARSNAELRKLGLIYGGIGRGGEFFAKDVSESASVAVWTEGEESFAADELFAIASHKQLLNQQNNERENG